MRRAWSSEAIELRILDIDNLHPMKNSVIRHTRNRLALLAFGLMVGEVLLIILSWLLSATRMEGVRSLLSSEGIQWLLRLL